MIIPVYDNFVSVWAIITIGCDYFDEVRQDKKHAWSENLSLARFWMTFIAGKTENKSFEKYNTTSSHWIGILGNFSKYFRSKLNQELSQISAITLR